MTTKYILHKSIKDNILISEVILFASGYKHIHDPEHKSIKDNILISEVILFASGYKHIHDPEQHINI